MIIEIVTGDDVAELLQLHKNGEVFVISGGATVKAAVVSSDKTKVLIGPVTQSSASTGADFSASLVALVFAETDTAPAAPALAKIEIQVEDGEKNTWFFDARIIQGNIA